MTDTERLFMTVLVASESAKDVLMNMIESRDRRIDELVREVNSLVEDDAGAAR